MSQCCSIDYFIYQPELQGIVSMCDNECTKGCAFEVEFDLNHPYVLNEEDILNIISASLVYKIVDDD